MASIVLKDFGASTVALRLSSIEPKAEADIRWIGNRAPWPSRAFVEEWLSDEEAVVNERKNVDIVTGWGGL